MHPELFDMTALRRARVRAQTGRKPALFLHERAALEIKERLVEVNRSFTDAAVITAFDQPWRAILPDARILPEADTLDLQPQAHDLIVHALSMHWANDIVGQLVQCRRALKPDGLFLGVLFGGRTLQELRSVLAEAEVATTGGLSPRVAPMAELRDLGGLLQRAGFALPVADADLVAVSYDSLAALAHDLRAMGETNVQTDRLRQPTRRAVFDEAARLYTAHYPSTGSGRICASFEIVTLTGWAPDAAQQKPLRPGSAVARLADALGTEEFQTGDSTGHDKR